MENNESALNASAANPAQAVINALTLEGAERDEHIQRFYDGIGQMARMLHSATRRLDEVHSTSHAGMIELDKKPEDNFLRYARSLTASAASDVLDHLEAATPLIENSKEAGKQIDEDIDAVLNALEGVDVPEELKQRLQHSKERLSEQTKNLDQLSTYNGDIMMLQSYQDLTSQAITKAEDLLGCVESKLAELLASFNEITPDACHDLDEPCDTCNCWRAHQTVEVKAAAEEEDPAAQMGQDDVDALLSQLGF